VTETSSTDPHASEPTDPTKCSGEEGFCLEHGFHRHSLKQPAAEQPHPTDCRCACDGCYHHNAYPVPPADDLRELYAKAIYERNNPGHRWEEAHPDDVLAYGSDADAILTVRDLELDACLRHRSVRRPFRGAEAGLRSLAERPDAEALAAVDVLAV